ncbi:zinc transporter 2-like [Ananas comosus]|uniref:Zinc transporter 2-like n=1 Tax=Ananas comosus TaxID=4615 RepID=A0A6P5FZZ3_ANACO|nr:zinc transporter 2-like [Ananas comosus]
MARLLPLVPIISLLLLLASSAAAHGGGSDDDDDSGGAQPNLRAKSLILVKVWCLIIVFVGTFVGGVSPYFLKWDEGFLVLGTQFAGGVFLGTALMHFLSDSNETFEDLTDKEYPFAFMLASAGFVITMLADCVIAIVVARGSGVRDVERGGGGGNGDGGALQESKLDANNGNSNLQSEAVNGTNNHSVAAMLRDADNLGDSILLIVALCFHSVFEGIAIGVAETKADAWKALWTISLHKIFAAIAMGIALLRMIPNRPLLSCAAYAFAFAISSPIGVAIGIIIDSTTEGHVADWIYAISMGLACGVFVYVSINHLLAKGYKPQRPLAADSPVNRWLAVVAGVGVIAVVMIWDT